MQYFYRSFCLVKYRPEKPLKERLIKTNRVDINVLKSKLREKENIAFKKNLLVLISCLAFIAVAGVYATQL